MSSHAPLTLSAVVADQYTDPEDGPLDHFDAFDAAMVVSEFLHERAESVAQLPAVERAAVERLWQAEDAWEEPDENGIDEAGNLTPEFQAVIEAQAALGEMIRATFARARE